MNLFRLLWIMVIVGLIGNASVVFWRCTKPQPQRGSVLSIVIIILAVADFLYCVHLILLESYVAREVFGGLSFTASKSNASNSSNSSASNSIASNTTAKVICAVSGNLSLFSSSVSMWMILNIAVYSFQSLAGRHGCCDFCCNCYCNCCSLVNRKGCLLVTVLCQLLFTTLPYTIFSIYINGLYEQLPNELTTKNVSVFLTACSFAQTTNQLVGAGSRSRAVSFGVSLASLPSSEYATRNTVTH